MQLYIGFNVKRNKKTMVSDIIKFFEVRGYTLVDANSQGMIFKRGSILGSLTSLSPLMWKTRVRIEILSKERMDYDLFAKYNFSTLGQAVTQEEKEYFREEVDAFEKAISLFQVDEEKALQMAQNVKRTNCQYLIWSFPLGMLLALLIIFPVNVSLTGSLPFLASSGIVIASIISAYFILPKVKKF
ncbi:MAG: hypothetical protein ACEPOZ_20835 [Marinifilaceae bacterium]